MMHGFQPMTFGNICFHFLYCRATQKSEKYAPNASTIIPCNRRLQRIMWNKAILRSFKPTANYNRRIDYVIDNNFDVLRKFMILFDNPNDINNILEARLQINSYFTTYKLDPKQFIRISPVCYEMNFIIENNSSTQMILPLVAMCYHKYIQLSFFIQQKFGSSNKCPQMVCEYYDLSTSIRSLLASYGNIYFHFNIFRIAKYIKSEKYAPYASTQIFASK
jgi:hypothetical protein